MTIFILFTVLGIFVLSDLARRAKKDEKMRKWQRLAVLLFLAGELTLGFFTFIKPGLDEQHLREAGLRGEATIVSVSQTGSYHNRNPEVEMWLEVRLQGREPYRAKAVFVLQQIDIPRYVEGASVVVLVDRDDPQNLLVNGLVPK